MNDRTARNVGFVAGLALFAVLGVAMGERPVALAVPLAAGLILTGVVAAWRELRDWPLALTLGVAVVGVVALGSVSSSSLVWMAFCVMAGWVALESRTDVTAWFGGSLLLIFLAEWLVDVEEPGWAAWSVGVTFTLVACTFARRLRQTVADLRAAQEELAERTRLEERGRIAAEMHDVIGHALTVSVLHIGGARLALDEDPEEARRALDEAEKLTRQSLEEVRSTVGLMRSDRPGEQAPMPDASELTELVESFRRAGADVRLRTDGGLAGIGASRGLVVYRIVQEAVTNATKHAPATPVTVQVERTAERTRIEVTNPLRDAPIAPPVEGSGLRGMRERARSVGGSLTAGPGPEGWRVEAELPS